MPIHSQAKRLGLAAAISMAVTLAVPASAEVRQVDGNLWEKSSAAEKQAYLVGVSNVLSVNQAVRVKRGTVDPQEPLAQYLRATDTQTIKAIQDRLDYWYKNNPDKLDTPVLGVIWMGLVKGVN